MARTRSDAGFTLVELLVAIAILGIIMVPLSGGLSAGYRTVADTSNRAGGSSDAQRLSIYLPPDVQSATTATATASGCTGLVGTAKLQLKNAANTFNVVYTITTATPAVLTRYVCTTGAAANRIVIARNVKNDTSVTVTITGSPFTKVSMLLAEAITTNDTYSFTVTGQRRAA